MERNLFFTVLIGTLILIAVALFIPGQRGSGSVDTLPWRVGLDAEGRSQVFGLTLEKSSLGEVERVFGEEAEVSLFSRGEGDYVVEAFFDAVTLNGLKASFVMVVDLAPEALAESYRRGVRIATMGSGTRKVTLASEDLARVRATPIRSITYLPKINLDAALLEKRFGKPSERVSEREGVEHWLYPRQGIDIALHQEGKEVLHYVVPSRFSALREPLRSLEQNGDS